MADQRLRQRGWSIQSSDDNTITTRPNQRARAESTATAATEPSLSHDEKVALMNSAFDNVHDDSNDDDDDIVIPGIDVPDSHDAGEDSCDNNDDNDHRKKKKRKLSSLESKTSNSQEAMTTPRHQQQPPHVELTTFQQEKLDLAKGKLSKWAARLFDPNRIRGLVEPPKTIPLNDEFLTAFGKREKEYDELIGRSADIDKTSLDIIDVHGSDDDDGDQSSGLRGGGVGNTVNKVNYSAVSTGKVRMTNLSYSTSTEALSQVCELIGPVINVNLILDEYKQSTGRAYV
eukprot:scaffold112720_cov37-Cyclotella_meneghiniana.AAC.1